MPVNRAQSLFKSSIEDATNAYQPDTQERKSRRQRRNQKRHRNEPQESFLANSNVLSETEQREIMSLLSMFPEMEPGVIVNVFRAEKGNSIATIDKLLELAQEMESEEQEKSESETEFDENLVEGEEDSDEPELCNSDGHWNAEEVQEENDQNEEGYEVLDEEQEQYEDDFEPETEESPDIERDDEPEQYDGEEEEPEEEEAEDHVEEEPYVDYDYPEEEPEQEDQVDDELYEDDYVEEYVQDQEEEPDELESGEYHPSFLVTPIQATPNHEESGDDDNQAEAVEPAVRKHSDWVTRAHEEWESTAKFIQAQSNLRKLRKREMKMALKLQAAAQMEYMRMRIKELEDTVARVEEEKKKGMSFVLHQIAEIKKADLIKDGHIADRDRIISEQSQTILNKEEEIAALSTQVSNLSVQLENREILNLENFFHSSKELLSDRAQSVHQNLQKNVTDGIAKLESHDIVQQIREIVTNLKEEVTKNYHHAKEYYNGQQAQPGVQVEAQVEKPVEVQVENRVEDQDEEFEKALKASMESFNAELKERASRHAMGIPN